jgi:hypothetical protein
LYLRLRGIGIPAFFSTYTIRVASSPMTAPRPTSWHEVAISFVNYDYQDAGDAILTRIKGANKGNAMAAAPPARTVQPIEAAIAKICPADAQ